MIQNLQIDTSNAESHCIQEVEAFLALGRDLADSGKYDLDYFAGRHQKGNGEGSAAGYKADLYT